MQYKNLNDLLLQSSSSKQYFLSLPVELQLTLHEHSNYIHSACELHARVNALKAYNRAVEISESLYGSSR